MFIDSALTLKLSSIDWPELINTVYSIDCSVLQYKHGMENTEQTDVYRVPLAIGTH